MFIRDKQVENLQCLPTELIVVSIRDLLQILIQLVIVDQVLEEVSELNICQVVVRETYLLNVLHHVFERIS